MNCEEELDHGAGQWEHKEPLISEKRQDLVIGGLPWNSDLTDSPLFCQLGITKTSDSHLTQLTLTQRGSVILYYKIFL